MKIKKCCGGKPESGANGDGYYPNTKYWLYCSKCQRFSEDITREGLVKKWNFSVGNKGWADAYETEKE